MSNNNSLFKFLKEKSLKQIIEEFLPFFRKNRATQEKVVYCYLLSELSSAFVIKSIHIRHGDVQRRKKCHPC